MTDMNNTDYMRPEFDDLKRLFEEKKLNFEVVRPDEEMSPIRNSYIAYRFPVARATEEIRIYDDDPNIPAIINSDFPKYRGITNYEAIYSSELKCVECEVQSNRSPTASYILYRLTRHMGQEVPVVLFHDQNVKVSIGYMSTELAFISMYKRNRRPLYNFEKSTNRTSIRIENVDCGNEVKARKILEKTANSLFYQIDLLFSFTITMVSRKVSRYDQQKNLRGRIEQFPNASMLKLDYEYDEIPLSLYWFAQNNMNSPFFRYFALYQVLEYYLPIYAAENLKRRMRLLVKDPQFNINNDADVVRLVDVVRVNSSDGFGDEKEQLAVTLRSVTTGDEVIDFLSEHEYLLEYYKGKHSLVLTDKKIRVSDRDGIISDLAARIYDIRCRIVHNKASESDKKILPLTENEKDLLYDVELLQYIARKAIIANSRPFSFT